MFHSVQNSLGSLEWQNACNLSFFSLSPVERRSEKPSDRWTPPIQATPVDDMCCVNKHYPDKGPSREFTNVSLSSQNKQYRACEFIILVVDNILWWREHWLHVAWFKRLYSQVFQFTKFGVTMLWLQYNQH